MINLVGFIGKLSRFFATLLPLVLLFPLDLLCFKRTMKQPNDRYDERDTMFARMAWKPGSDAYQHYYSVLRPQNKPFDDRIRKMPALLQPGGRHFDKMLSPEAGRWFDKIETIVIDPIHAQELALEIMKHSNPTGTIKRIARSLGAVKTGCTRLYPSHIYSHKGRFPENYGQEISLDHPFVILFLVEMDFQAMRQSPRAPVIHESARQYYRAARIAKTLAAVLQAAGYKAKAHYDAHYDIILPPLAELAGLGEVGRNNILVADKFGSRVRIAAVTTDFPVKIDHPVNLGVRDFCRICKKCSENCPSRALETGEEVISRGVHKWATDQQKCYAYWRKTGTDCGICMAVCPYSHKNNLFHNSVRFSIRLNPWIRKIALYCDDLIYGRKWKVE